MRRSIPILLLSGACLLSAAGCDDDNPVDVIRLLDFAAVMTGAKERPDPVSPAGTGTATFRLDEAETAFAYTISVSNMTSAITAAHIHLGDEDTAGGIIVTLTTPVNGGTVTGTITRMTALGLGISFDSLIDLMRNHDTYVNVHTANNPNGEIRGQIDPVP